MSNIFSKFAAALSDKILRRRILFVLGILILFRLGAAIPIPGVDITALQRVFSENGLFSLLNIFSGGGLSNLSIFMLGVGPFITGSIIMQLLTIMFPSLKAMYHEEGEIGRRRFAQYSRWLTVPLAALQGFALLFLLEKQGVVSHLLWTDRLLNIMTVIAGSVLLMWLGELINEYGIGNGVSLIIFAGILSGLPRAISQIFINFDAAQLPLYLALAVASIVIVAGVVVITEAERPIPVTYAKRVRGAKVYGGSSTYLPLRLNQSGVMPIIFALSILLFPQMIVSLLARIDNATVQSVANNILLFLNNGWVHAVAYFILVFGFTYFYSAITFDPESLSHNLQRNGAFIPGIRPGQPTAEYVARSLYHLTFVGALFLGIMAMLPLATGALTGLKSLTIGGTALLIVVSVAIDFMKQIDAQLSMREY